MKDYRQGIDEMDIDENEKFISQKDVLIHEDRDISIKVVPGDLPADQTGSTGNLKDNDSQKNASSLSILSGKKSTNQQS